MRSLRSDLRHLPRMAPPSALTMKLRVLASREAARPNRIRWWDRTRLVLTNVLRPLAMPAVGGVLASVLMFVMLVDTLMFRTDTRNDDSLGLYTKITMLDVSPFAFTGNDVTVELTIDQDGRLSGYSGLNGTLTRDEMKRIGNMLLFTSFTPATAYGQPVSGKVLVRFHRIDVRG
jgi:hypothetical protein